jgi:hypothetical protein
MVGPLNPVKPTLAWSTVQVPLNYCSIQYVLRMYKGK